MSLGQNYILYAAGSPLIVDYEEAIRSRDARLSAIVKNHDSAVFALDQNKVVEKNALSSKALSKGHVIVPLFTPGHRCRVAAEVVELSDSLSIKARFGRLVHQSAVVAASAQIDEGVFVNAGVTIGGAARIGVHCIINRAASIGHHVKTGAYVSIGPGAVLAGQIAVGPGTVIGAGAVVHPGVTIGANAVVAAGAVVTIKNVPANTVFSGHPAKLIGRPIIGYGKASVPTETG